MTLTVEELFAPFITAADEGRVGPEAYDEAAAIVRGKLLTLHDTERAAFFRLMTSPEFLRGCIQHADALGVAPSCDPAPDTSHEAWVSAVANGDTDLGYEDWAHDVLCAFDDEEE